LAKDTMKIIPKNFVPYFKEFHKSFKQAFESKTGESELCLKCKNVNTTPICMHCYINEVFGWFKDKNYNIARKFIQKFSFGFDIKMHKNIIASFDEKSITELGNEKHNFGICDDCGEYSEELKLSNGKFVCSSCGE